MNRTPEYLTEIEVSKLIKRSVSALRKDRCYGRGLPYVKNGRQVLYVREYVDQGLMKNLVMPRSEV